MANSNYEYVKSSFEDKLQDEILIPNIIVVRINGCDFNSFCQVHQFVKPNDEKGLNLMNICARSVMQRYPDIVFAYGFSDEYSFVFKMTTQLYNRRASKLQSVIASSFASFYVENFKQVFPCKELKYAPSFRAKVVSCATLEVLQRYLAWRQNDCHKYNLFDNCFWKLISELGKSESEAREFLKGTQRKQDQIEFLFRNGTIYKNLSAIFRQGSCLLKTQAEEIIHTRNIAARRFWNEQPDLVKKLGAFAEEIDKNELEYMKSCIFKKEENKLMPLTWIVVRIDGCNFHKFSKDHKFQKPNDEQALMLMNSCAIAILEKFQDVVFAYGTSDEYSFVLKNGSQFCQRKASEIMTIIGSFFSSTYVMKWKEFFPTKNLNYCPSFDARVVCYPSYKSIRDYLSWRQVDCHINNQNNSLFWELVKWGKSKREAHDCLKGTQAQEKKDLLLRQFGTDYNTLKDIFRHGSSVYRIKEEWTVYENGKPKRIALACNIIVYIWRIILYSCRFTSLSLKDIFRPVYQIKEERIVDENGKPKRIALAHCNIIANTFWKAHPSILDE